MLPLPLEPVEITPPENSTSSPALRAGPATRSSAFLVCCESLSTETAKWMSANPIVRFLDSVRGDFRFVSETPTVCGTCSASLIVGLTSLLYCGSVSLCPGGAANTIRASAPPVPGNFALSRLSACWDWVPGTLNASSV